MASSNRDLTIGLISKLDKFDLKDAENQFDKLGEKAKDAGRETEKGMETAGDAVKAVASGDTRREMDAFFDKMGRSAKQAGRDVNAGMDRASEGVDDFKQEAQQTARESAASFSGSFEDAADAVQETLANALSGFGPIGAAAGIAAAAGLGTLLTKFNEAKERAAELRKELVGLVIEGAGSVSSDSLFGRIRQMAEDGTLTDLRQQAKDANLSLRDLVRAEAGDLDAAQRLNDELATRLDLLEKDDSANSQQIDRLRTRKSAIETIIESLQYAADMEGVYAEATGDASRKQEEAAKAAEVSASRYKTVADAVKQVGDATDELATLADEKGQITAKAIEDTLKAQTKAAQQFAADLLEVQKTGDAEFLEWVSQQPAEVAKAYADGTEAEKAGIYSAFKANVGMQMTLAIAAGIAEGRPGVVRQAEVTRAAAEAAATGQPIKLSIGVTQGFSRAEIWAIRAEAQRQLSAAGALKVPVMLGSVQPGTWSARDIP